MGSVGRAKAIRATGPGFSCDVLSAHGGGGNAGGGGGSTVTPIVGKVEGFFFCETEKNPSPFSTSFPKAKTTPTRGASYWRPSGINGH